MVSLLLEVKMEATSSRYSLLPTSGKKEVMEPSQEAQPGVEAAQQQTSLEKQSNTRSWLYM